MNEEVKMVVDDAKENMESVISFLNKEYHKLRAGKASPDMLESIKIECYGSMMPINQVANVNAPDAKQLIVQPWDKNNLSLLEKEIRNANLGFNPINNGEVLRIIVPALTEERRKDIVKQAKQIAEQSKVSVRSVRKTANDMAKTLKNDGVSEDEIKSLEDQIQELTDDYTKQIDEIYETKEKEIMTV